MTIELKVAYQECFRGKLIGRVYYSREDAVKYSAAMAIIEQVEVSYASGNLVTTMPAKTQESTMLEHRGDALHCTECGREYDAQDELLTQCPSDDCPGNVAPAMNMQSIGIINDGCDGTDEYILVKSNEADITPEQVREWLLPQFYCESNRAGSYFCTSISVQQVQYRPSEVIAIVHHRYDV